MGKDFSSEFEAFLKKRNEPSWLTEYRRKNFKVFLDRPLKKSQYINVPKLEELLLPFDKKTSLTSPKQKGVEVFSFEEAVKKFPQKIKVAIEKESAPKDQFEAFTNAFFSTGFFVLVSKDFAGEKIELNVTLESKSVSKNFLFFENQNKAIVFEKISGKENFALCENNFLEDGASVEICRLHDHEDESTGFFYNQSMLENYSFFVNSNAWLNGKLLRSNTYNNLVGKGSQVKQFDVLLLDKKQLFDLNNTAMHIEGDSNSYTVFKGIMAEESKSVFDAMIKIVKNAQHSTAFLEAHSMLLSESASSNNVPGLEIEADDVKASHSASVAQVDEEQLYYLQSRGITYKRALNMIITGFVESVLLNLDEKLSQSIFLELEKKTQRLG